MARGCRRFAPNWSLSPKSPSTRTARFYARSAISIRETPGVAARVLGALKCVNVRMISQGASLLNLGVVMPREDLQKAAAALHREFFTERDPAVFG